jgi:hypothetical protein
VAALSKARISPAPIASSGLEVYQQPIRSGDYQFKRQARDEVCAVRQSND